MPVGLAGYGYEIIVITPQEKKWPLRFLNWAVQMEIVQDAEMLERVQEIGAVTIEHVRREEYRSVEKRHAGPHGTSSCSWHGSLISLRSLPRSREQACPKRNEQRVGRKVGKPAKSADLSGWKRYHSPHDDVLDKHGYKEARDAQDHRGNWHHPMEIAKTIRVVRDITEIRSKSRQTGKRHSTPRTAAPQLSDPQSMTLSVAIAYWLVPLVAFVISGIYLIPPTFCPPPQLVYWIPPADDFLLPLTE